MQPTVRPTDDDRTDRSAGGSLLQWLPLVLVVVLPLTWEWFRVDETWHSRTEIRAAHRDAVWDDVPDSMTRTQRFESGAQHSWVPWRRLTSKVGARYESAEPSVPISLGAWRVAAERAGWQLESASCGPSAEYGELTFTRRLADRPARLFVKTDLLPPDYLLAIEVGDDPSRGYGAPKPAELERCAPRPG